MLVNSNSVGTRKRSEFELTIMTVQGIRFVFTPVRPESSNIYVKKKSVTVKAPGFPAIWGDPPK